MGGGKPSNLSSIICDEFIPLMGEKLNQVTAEEFKHAIYFSLMVGSVPDLAHMDQLTFVFGFCSAAWRLVERFIGFELESD